MPQPLPELLHQLANRVQAASAAAMLLQPAAGDASAVRLQRIMDELRRASELVQAMCRAAESRESKKQSA